MWHLRETITEVKVISIRSSGVGLSEQGNGTGPVFIGKELFGKIERWMCGSGNGIQRFLPTCIRKCMEILGGAKSSTLDSEKGQGFGSIEKRGGQQAGIKMNTDMTTPWDTSP